MSRIAMGSTKCTLTISLPHPVKDPTISITRDKISELRAQEIAATFCFFLYIQKFAGSNAALHFRAPDLALRLVTAMLFSGNLISKYC